MKRVVTIVLLALVVIAGLWLTSVLLAGTGYPVLSGDGGGDQPIAFPHARHVALGIDCAACHAGVTQGKEAGIPPDIFCKGCHLPRVVTQPGTEAPPSETQPAASEEASKPAVPTSPELKSYLEKDEEIPWVQHQRTPRHVFFSHRRHVVLAELDCAECHGDIEHQDEPIDRAVFPTRLYGMNRCVNCHVDKAVTSDCLACHR